MIITAHAAARYIERIDPSLTADQAEHALRRSAHAVQVAASIGCRVVRLGSGAKLILEGEVVKTVLPAGGLVCGHVGRPWG